MLGFASSPQPTSLIYHMSFFFTDWPKDEGPWRRVDCNLGRNVMIMTREDIEKLDQIKQRFICHMDRRSFRFRGGMAEVNITVDSLDQLYPALRALHDYLSASVTNEE